jgi:hypothetical protein
VEGVAGGANNCKASGSHTWRCMSWNECHD